MEREGLRLIVEGIADQKFLTDFISFHFSFNLEDSNFIRIDGNTDELLTKKAPVISLNVEGTNLAIFDADEDPQTTRSRYSAFFGRLVNNHDLFLFPDNTSTGNLETLLIQIVNPKHQSILDCLETYKNCLEQQSRGYKTPVLKTMVYAYLDTLLPRSKEKYAKEENRDYTNDEHWNLSYQVLTALKEFLRPYFT